MKEEFNIEFPCGFKIKRKSNISFWDMQSMKTIPVLDVEVGYCPIHGKKCKRADGK